MVWCCMFRRFQGESRGPDEWSRICGVLWRKNIGTFKKENRVW